MDKTKRTIWMDLTNSLVTWKGGIVGIVRAELEIAKNIKEFIPDLRYCVFTGHGFEEVQPEQISWLWTENSIGDGYLKHRHIDKRQIGNEELKFGVGYVGLEEAYRYSASRKSRLVGGLKYFGKSLPRIIRFPIKLTYKAAVHIRNAFKRPKRDESLNAMDVTIINVNHPFGENDLVFSCGWMTSRKEDGYLRVKENLTDLKVVYLIYDTILYRTDTRRFYHPQATIEFEKYLRWVSLNCVAILTGGETARLDMNEYQKEHMLPRLPGFPVKFGADIIRDDREPKAAEVQEYFRKIGVKGNYLISVGSLDKRKNYDTLYRAFTILADRGWNDCPQLVIVGRGDAYEDLLITIKQDLRTMKQILFVTPTDEELNCLYRHAKFSVLASAYEGWSLTLPEALGYGKFAIAADNAPLREIGKDLISYVDTYDPYAWSDKIYYYCTHDDDLKKCEEKIRAEWKSTTWKDCANQVADYLKKISSCAGAIEQPLYFDATLTVNMAVYGGQISGILRTELMLMKYLHRLHPSLHFFSWIDSEYVAIKDSSLEPILYGSDIDKGFEQSRGLLYNNVFGRNKATSYTAGLPNNGSKSNLKSAIWLFVSCLPRSSQIKIADFGKKTAKTLAGRKREREVHSNDIEKIKYAVPFTNESVVFSCGSGYWPEICAELIAAKKAIGFRYCGVIYDFTPVILPQTHNEETKSNYGPFLEFMSKISDCILYGGKTAQRDGISYFQSQGLPVPQSYPIYFGSDAVMRKRTLASEKDEAILSARGVNRPFVLIVGTLEARKNHETIYRAYLRMLGKFNDVPQVVFAGRVGWRTNSMLETIAFDERVKENILIFAPSDIELDVLYRNCEFTILPSMYEGWSLTLPESYYYEKFCLCCDTPSLKETAGNLAEYIQPFDEVRWSERIMYYHQNREELSKREILIRENWHMITWAECAEQVYGYLKDMMDAKNVCIEAEK